jgi:hypothetical protein
MSSATNQDVAGSSRDHGGRIFGSGPGRLFGAAGAAAVIVGVVLALVLTGGGKKSSVSSIYAYHKGQIPAWIPDTNAPANPKLITATLQKPTSTLVEGDVVHAIFTHGMGKVTVAGPTEPDWVATAIQDGKSKWGDRSPGSFYVSFNDVQGTLPVAAKNFVAMTPDGKIHATTVGVKGGGKVPTTLHQGQTLTLVIHFKLLPAGQGALAWAPAQNKLLAGWDYDFELT